MNSEVGFHGGLGLTKRTVPMTTFTHRDDGWRAFRICGELEFSLIGVLAGISKVLAKNEVGIFVIPIVIVKYFMAIIGACKVEGIMMTLSKEDGQLFYSLWYPLLDYADRIQRSRKKRKALFGFHKLDYQVVREVADELWKNEGIIDLYLKERTDLPEDHKSILLSWKRRIQGKFIVVKHQKDGTVFVSADNLEVYLVKGIVSDWKEMTRGVMLPVMIDATLIPFRDVIISDGVISPYDIVFGGEMKRELKNVYKVAKENDQIHRSI